MEVKAKLRYYRQSPRKVRLVTSFIRNLDVKSALDQLRFANKRAAEPIRKLIESAVANAKHNFELNPNNLYIKHITVDDGPTLKRWRARAFGKAAMIKKRTSHVSVILDEKNPSKKQTRPVELNKEKIKTVKKLSEIKEKNALLATEQETRHKKIDKQKGFMPKIFRRKAG
ncbi:MAG: 50S ribosomal protein L22 [Candidatus Jacksonbacteria bacterium]